KLEKCLVARDKKGKPTINSHCFQAAVSKLNWKATCNKHHHYQKISNTHIYSQDAIDEIVRQITMKDNFIEQAKSQAKKKRNKQAALA
ncbi:DUF3644 domain-containing protein, partial [Vibrio vulnificus]|nr:DUF3644 domain-containing protein [Vibrio vulnificus]